MNPALRFFHPVLPSRDLKGEIRPVEVAGRRYTLRRDVALGPVVDDPLGFRAKDAHGYIWLGAADLGPSAMPSLDYTAEGFELVGAFGARFLAPLHVALDNFCEDEHTPWVHRFLGWREPDLDRLEFDAEGFDDHTAVRYRAPQRPSPYTPALLIKRGDMFCNTWETRFDPVRTVYTLHWEDPKTGAKRPVVSRFAIFFVPESRRSTWLHSFAFAKLLDARFRFLMPVVRRLVPFLGKNEVNDDARFIPNVAETGPELRGMRLGRYDKPLVLNHKLLEKIYWAP